MKKFVVLVFCLFIIAGCTKPATDNVSSTQSIKVGMLENIAAVPYIYADEQEQYTLGGINVELILFKSVEEMLYSYNNNMIDAVQMVDFNLESEIKGKKYVGTKENFKIISNEYTTQEFDYNINGLAHMQVGIINDYDTKQTLKWLENVYNIKLNSVEYDSLEAMNEDFKSEKMDAILVGDYFPLSNIFYQERIIWDSNIDKNFFSVLILNDNFQDLGVFEKFLAITNSVIASKQLEDYRELVLAHKLVLPEDYYNNMPPKYTTIGQMVKEE